MKRKWAFLTLPILLAALMLGVKWRAEHPTPTKEDLEVRALMLKSFRADIEFYKYGSDIAQKSMFVPSDKEWKPLIGDFYGAQTENDLDMLGGLVIINYIYVEGRVKHNCRVRMGIDNYVGYIGYDSQGVRVIKSIHPITVKRWTELLLANPRIGPELRARMK